MKHILFVITVLVSFSTGQTLKKIDPEIISYLPEIGNLKSINFFNGKVKQYIVEDINLDGKLEYIIVKDESPDVIDIFTNRTQRFQQLAFTYDLKKIHTVADIDSAIILTVGLNGEKLNIYTYNFIDGKYDSISTLNITDVKDTNSDNEIDITDTDVKFYDIPGEKYKKIILINTGHDQGPRAIYLFDILKQKIDWTFPSVASPGNVLILGNSITWEVLLSTNAVDRKVPEKNGFRSSVSYLIKLYNKGVIKDSIVFGKLGVYSRIYWFSQNQDKIFLLAGSSNDDSADSDYIALIDPEDLSINYNQHISGISSVSYYSEVIDSSAIFSKSIFGNRTVINKHNPDLTVSERLYFEGMEIRHVNVINLDIDNKPELIIRFIDEPYSLIIDVDFNPIGKVKLPVGLVEEIPFGSLHYNETVNENSLYLKDNYLWEWRIPIRQVVPVSSLNLFYKENSNEIKTIIFILTGFVILAFLTLHIIIKSRKLMYAEKLYSFFMDEKSRAVIVVDQNNIIVDMNNVALNLLKNPNTNFIGKKLNSFGKKSKLHSFFSQLAKILKKGSNVHEEFVFSLFGKNHKYLVDINSLVVTNSALYIIELSSLDIFSQNEQLAAWASMAQRVAHQIKNPLQTILLAMRQIQKKINKSEKKQQEYEYYFESTIKEIERLRNTTNDFMRFVQILNNPDESINIDKVIKRVVEIYQTHPEIKFKLQVEQNLPLISMSENELLQIVNNIVENSIDAIEDSGIIEIRCFLMEECIDHELKQFVCLEVIDTGNGIPEKNIANVFEPNFTNKNTGTGFGLAIVKMIVTRRGGDVSVKSKEKVGTTLQIKLPLKH